MRFTYEWTSAEWEEAVALAAHRRGARSSLSGLTFGLILVSLLAGLADSLASVNRERGLHIAHSVFPLLMALAFAALAVLLAAFTLKNRRLRASGMPSGPCEAIVQEAGWRFLGTCPERRSAVADHAETTARLAAQSTDPLVPWSDLKDTRFGDRVIVFLHQDGFYGLPTRCLSEDQAGRMQRMITRKLRSLRPVR